MGFLARVRSMFGQKEKALSPVPQGGGWWRLISEPFTGAWQRNESERVGDVTCYPTLYACINRRAQDVGKLPFRLMEYGPDGIPAEVSNPAFSPVLRKPNHYQTQAQFRESWILSKLQQGNTYALKERDARGVVVKLYILDPCRVQPLVSELGEVFYQIWTGMNELVPEIAAGQTITVPAREIIHDRCVTLHHPLIGVPPLCAAYWPTVKNLRLLRSSAEFFGNGARPGGILSAPGSISDQTAAELKEYWNTNFTGENAGKVAVIGDGLKYEQLKETAADSQLVEQMKYSDEQICQPFSVPPFIVGIGSIPAGLKVDDMMSMYYALALQADIEHMEYLLDEGLGITKPLSVELNLEPLLRMDATKLAEFATKLVGGKIMTPDEGRRGFGLPPTAGGNTLWGQHQDYPLGELAKRNDLSAPAPTTAAPVPDDEVETRALIAAIEKQFEEAA